MFWAYQRERRDDTSNGLRLLASKYIFLIILLQFHWTA